METRAHYVLIGVFSVLVVTAALLFGPWLAKSSSDKAFNEYDIVFNEAVTGLSQGASVQYSGIKVGDVTRLSLDPADPRRVFARIRVAGGTPVKQDTHAKLALTGITGLAIIQLSGGSPQSAALAEQHGKIPLIVADPSPLNKLLATNRDAINHGMQGVAELGPAMHELRTTLSSLKAVTRQLDQNPSGYLLGRDKPQEFVP